MSRRGGQFLLASAILSLCVLSAVVAVIGAFISPALPHVLGVPVPVGALVAFAGNLAIGLGGGWAIGSRYAPAATGVVWLLIALVLGSDGPGKDIVVTGTARGFGFLFAGALAAALAVAVLTSPRFDPERRRAAAARSTVGARGPGLHLPPGPADYLDRGDPDARRGGG
jgi:hypothetical protein